MGTRDDALKSLPLRKVWRPIPVSMRARKVALQKRYCPRVIKSMQIDAELAAEPASLGAGPAQPCEAIQQTPFGDTTKLTFE